MKNCGGCVNDGTSGSDSKENSGCLANSENCDEGHKEDGGNDKDGLHGGVCVGLEIPAVLAFVKLGSVEITAFLLSAVLSITRDRFRGWVITDLISSLHGLFTASAN